MRKKIKFHAQKKNKIVYKYEGGPRQRASDKMSKYKYLDRVKLPDFDLTVPVSNEITWGRPLTQEEIKHMNAVLGVPQGPEGSVTTIDRMNAVFGAQHGKKDKNV